MTRLSASCDTLECTRVHSFLLERRALGLERRPDRTRATPSGPAIEWCLHRQRTAGADSAAVPDRPLTGELVLPESEPIAGRWSSTASDPVNKRPAIQLLPRWGFSHNRGRLGAHRGSLRLSVSAHRTVGVITHRQVGSSPALDPGEEALAFSWEHRRVGRITARRRRRFLRHTDIDVALCSDSGSATLLVMVVTTHEDVDGTDRRGFAHAGARTDHRRRGGASHTHACERPCHRRSRSRYEETITFKPLR